LLHNIARYFQFFLRFLIHREPSSSVGLERVKSKRDSRGSPWVNVEPRHSQVKRGIGALPRPAPTGTLGR
jgi:hypothetical protein